MDLQLPTASDISKYDPAPLAFPLGADALGVGSAVAVAGEDAQTVAGLCGQAESVGLKEVWLDSQSPSAIQAAISSGLKVDLVVHPWAVLAGESCAEPDRTAVGQTGDQVGQLLPEGRSAYRNSFSPLDPDVSKHWVDLLALIPATGINRVIVEDARSPEFESRSRFRVRTDAPVVRNGEVVFPGLRDMVPELFEFGYSSAQRLEFLRKYSIDPVDLIQPQTVSSLPATPYFDPPNGVPIGDSGSVRFPSTRWSQMDNDKLFRSWMSMRHDDQGAKLSEGLDQVVQRFPTLLHGAPLDWHAETSYASPYAVGSETDSGDKAIEVFALDPLRDESRSGEIKAKPRGPDGAAVCFDLRNVPPSRISAYLSYLFKSK